MNDELNLEGRLRHALRAQGDRVGPDDESGLDRIRHRGARARRRRRVALAGAGTVLAVVAAFVVVPNLGDDPSRLDVVPADDTSTTAPPDPAPTTTTEVDGHSPVNVPSDIIWPPPGHELYGEPLEAVISFLNEYVGVPSELVEGTIGSVRTGGVDVAEVDVLVLGEGGAPVDRVASTVSVRRSDGEHWFVVWAESDDVVIEAPARLTLVESPVLVQGRARGFEGTVVLQLVAQGGVAGTADPEIPGPLATAIATAGCCEDLEPFSAELAYDVPAVSFGSLLAQSTSGADGGLAPFSVVPLRFAEPEAKAVYVTFIYGGDRLGIVERPLSETSGVLRFALEALLEGPTAQEQAGGFDSVLSEDSDGLLAGVTIDDGLAVVDFDERIVERNRDASSSEGSRLLLAQLNDTVLQFDTVQRVEYRVGGSCDTFGQWTQRGCGTYDRSDVGDYGG